MLGKRKFRIGERMQARRGAPLAGATILTEEDEANIEAYTAKVGEAVALLNEEVAALTDGRFQVVSELFERKSALLKWLELRMPLIEPFLKHEAAKARGLPERLAELKQSVGADSEMLQRMAMAAGTIVREIRKATERNGLSGLYGKSGQKIGSQEGGKLRIDREF
ncbi:flagellar biosynthesis protein FlgI [Antarcticimicrobium sediminis]|uniref:Flagellar biosynthesis protein FlgI n=1 Tax=Antarcticimicrobium sediminis TaxID=2546227 RepID=A0A4R5EV97_9RHOB|nr:flagellar biosynthesis protein FlgI [Antarcticimicrobium sediminis]TDE38889.1 flagellar biosynthesis protein FlgI [Antarcticimicrobium sediminis]